jgi:sulfate-transporting ATPase
VTEFLQLLVLGMATGGFYTMNALGIVVVFRSSGIINFASGGVAMVGGYLEWQLADVWGVPKGAAVLGAVLAAALVNLLIYVVAVRPLATAAALTKVIATLAVLVSIQQAIVLIFGGLPKVPNPFLPIGTTRIGSLQVGQDSLIVLLAAVVLTGALWLVYRSTRFGLATSALAEAPRSLSALGWNVDRLRAANWAVGGALAGLAGAGLGPILQLTPGSFTSLLIPTLACAMIGGLRSFPLTLAGGMLVGAAQVEASRYLSWSGSAQAVPFLLIIAVLVLRGRSLPLRSYVQERLPRVGSGEVRLPVLLGAVGLAAVLASVVQEEWVIGATISMMTATVLLSQVVITGYAGQLSLAQLTLGGVGAVVAANLSASYGTPFLVSLLVGMLAVIPVSLLVGLPSLRARGVSLAIATLGLAVALNAVVLTNSRFVGGLAGLRVEPQTLFGVGINSTLYPRRYFLVVLAVFTLLALAAANVRRGRSGRRLLAVRNNERAAKALGIDVTGAKLYAFVLAGVIAAAGGVLLVFNQALPQFTSFDPLAGLNSLVGAVLGGIGFVPGAIVGGLFNNNGLPNAILHPVVGDWTWWTQVFPLIIGLALVLQLIANPDGLAAPLTRSRRQSGKATAGSGPATAGSGPAADGSVPAADAPGAAAGGSGVASRLGRLSATAQRSAAEERRRSGYARELAQVDPAARRSRGCALSATGMRVEFGSVVALADVDITVQPGQVVSVIGPNGAGKTTLMDAITGFVPSSGTVVLGEQRIDRLGAHRRARVGLARSFQSLELFEDMTVMDNLRCASDPQDRASLLIDLVHPSRGAVTPATAAAIEAFGLHDKLDRLPTEIAYGDRRLVAIARALAGEPAVLLLDEPAAGLSEFERGEVARMITSMARDWGIAVLLIEHDVQLVRQVSDHVVALDFGRTIATGTPEQVLSHPDVVRAYLGTAPAVPAPLPTETGLIGSVALEQRTGSAPAHTTAPRR